ncbi:SufE family protein [Candidatus Similichlamydia epinepheli]|uniref:SufE family protein n=1 Tax=Candidatus Similichlamydia epinepheli TaxID=1903953 RepID=UPI000D3C1396|nr:SufE family protein [Candidatus Similichlamydia epinepheli]
MTLQNDHNREKGKFILLCKQRQIDLEKAFLMLPSIQKKYDLLIEKGKKLFNKGIPTPSNFIRVPGCQSKTFLKASMKEGLISFEGESDALISSGLLAMLLDIYSWLPPTTVLTCPPDFIERIGFHQFLSLNRATGLHQIYLQIRKESAYFLEKELQSSTSETNDKLVKR